MKDVLVKIRKFILVFIFMIFPSTNDNFDLKMKNLKFRNSAQVYLWPAIWALKRWFSLSAFSKSDFSWNGVQVGHKLTFLDCPDRPESGRDIIVTIWTRAFSIKSILLKRNASSSLIWPWIPSKTFPRSTLAFQVFWKIESSSSGVNSRTVDQSHRTNPGRCPSQPR